jgi:toxin YoeB
MTKLWLDDAWTDYEYCRSQDRKTLKRINLLLRDIERNGYGGVGKPEPLRGNLSGLWSVRIDGKNRIVFRINDNQLEIVSCKRHYGG